MKLMIASDIHGAAGYCRELLAAFDREGADRLLLLGDILYHGPRNDLPDEYAPKQVLAMLNERRERLFCVRGNCDTEVDQMVLTFPILADYSIFPVGSRLIYADLIFDPDGRQRGNAVKMNRVVLRIGIAVLTLTAEPVDHGIARRAPRQHAVSAAGQGLKRKRLFHPFTGACQRVNGGQGRDLGQQRRPRPCSSRWRR